MSKKSNIFLDMTAMCDVAFLLLTFFMLAGNFKDDGATVVDMPSSTAHEMLNNNNSFNITISKDSLLYFSVVSQDASDSRIKILRKMAGMNKVEFSEANLTEFGKMPEMGFPIRKLKAVLAFPAEERKNMAPDGIPVGELSEWVTAAVAVNPEVRISVRGDKNAPFTVVDEVLRMLQEKNINKFDLVTNLEN